MVFVNTNELNDGVMSTWTENTRSKWPALLNSFQATDGVQQSSDKMLWLLCAQTVGIVLPFYSSECI